LTDEQAAIEAQLTELHHHRFTLTAEQVLTIDLAIAAVNCEWRQRPTFARASQNMVAVATLLYTLPAPSAEGLDRVYHQLKDILRIAAAQQAESSL
jgi:hypothetical protein